MGVWHQETTSNDFQAGCSEWPSARKPVWKKFLLLYLQTSWNHRAVLRLIEIA